MMFKMFFHGEMPDGGKADAKAKYKQAQDDIRKARERHKSGAAPGLDHGTRRELAGLAAQIEAAKARRAQTDE